MDERSLRLTAKLAVADGLHSGRLEPGEVSVIRQFVRPRGLSSRLLVNLQPTALAELVQWLGNRSAQPLLAFDQNCRCLFVNEAAVRFIRNSKSIRLAGNKLTFLSAQYRSAVARIMRGGENTCSFQLRPRGAGSLLVSVVSLGDADSPLMLLTIAATATEELDEFHLQSSLGFTQAESAIALEIYKGASLVQIAKQRGSSVNTVKTQTRAIFQKCRVHSQVALTRRLSELLAELKA